MVNKNEFARAGGYSVEQQQEEGVSLLRAEDGASLPPAPPSPSRASTRASCSAWLVLAGAALAVGLQLVGLWLVAEHATRTRPG